MTNDKLLNEAVAELKARYPEVCEDRIRLVASSCGSMKEISPGIFLSATDLSSKERLENMINASKVFLDAEKK